MNYYHLVSFENEKPRAKIVNVLTFKRRKDVPAVEKNQKLIIGSNPTLMSNDINRGTYTITLDNMVVFCRNSTHALQVTQQLMTSSELEVRMVGQRMFEFIQSNEYGSHHYGLEDGTPMDIEVKP